MASKVAVCGCDGLDYWNASVAATSGMAVKATGLCASGGTGCGGFAGLSCPTKASCSYEVSDATGCNASDLGGRCWVIPASCTAPTIGPNTRACNSLSCTDECNLTKLGVTWYVDNTCPQ
jgi:hypothetical protein